MDESLSALVRQASDIGKQTDTGRIGFGAVAVDDWLGGGLRRDGMHEWYAASEDAPAAIAMALLVAERRRDGAGDVLWLRERRGMRGVGQLYGPGLIELGVDPDRFVLLRLADATAMLRAAADGVRHGGMAAVVLELHGDVPALDLTASRRLALAAARSGVMVEIVRADARPVSSVAHSRWQVAAAASHALDADAPGLPMFDLELLRNRGGREGLRCQLEWDRDQGCFRTPLSRGVSAPSFGRTRRENGRRVA